MNKTIQEIISIYSKFIDNATNIGLSENHRDLFFLLDSLVSEVKATYPFIPCKDKCSFCCVDSGLPRVASVEWQIIYNYLKNEMPEDLRNIVIDKTINMHSGQIKELIDEQERISVSHTQPEWKKKPRPDFKCMECPLLIDNSCTIYPVRPGICRAYGFFTIHVGEKMQLFTCQMAADQILDELRQQGVEHWAMPIWDKIADKIYHINRDNTVSTLPLWIFSHIDENKEFKKEMDKNPDFNLLLRKPPVND